MADARFLVPDRDVLLGIFPDLPDIAEDAYTVITNTFDTCTFRLRLPTAPRPGYPTDLAVRLGKAGSRLAAVAALQHLAYTQIPDLVLETLDVGTTSNGGKTSLEYTVTPWLDGTTCLEDVWSDLEASNQEALMNAVVVAMKKLGQTDTRSIETRKALDPSSDLKDLPSGGIFVGGADVGYHADTKPLLDKILHAKAIRPSACEIVAEEGISIRSVYEGVGAVQLSRDDLDSLHRSAAFCHNDLEPRNILVRRTGHDQAGGSPWFEISAIIDWEMAGFYPFSYESGLKDTILGVSSQYLRWYTLFKERTASLVPEGEAHDKLIKAIGIIAASNEKEMIRNVGVQVRSKWIGRHKLRMSSDVRRGWIREEGAGDAPVFAKEDNEGLELEVLKELGYI